jgi:hypothetical protein
VNDLRGALLPFLVFNLTAQGVPAAAWRPDL